MLQEETIAEEINLSQSPKPIRRRSNSSSSITSFASSDEEAKVADIPDKGKLTLIEKYDLENITFAAAIFFILVTFKFVMFEKSILNVKFTLFTCIKIF